MSARAFYAEVGVALPGSATTGSVPVRCFANATAHKSDDRDPSCSVNLETAQWKCWACGAKVGAFDAAVALGRSRSDAAELAKRHNLFVTDREQPSASQPRAKTRPPGSRLPAEARIAAWRAALLSNELVVARLAELRGWTCDALNALELGYDAEWTSRDGGPIVFVTRDAVGQLAGVEHYQPNPDKRVGKKLKAAAGSTRELFPAPEVLPIDQRVFVLEGGPDVVAMRSLGLHAVGVPGSEGWKSTWAPRFATREVVVCCDCDTEGRKLASRVATDLLPQAATVRVVDLDSTRDDGYDVGALVAKAAADGPAGLAQARSLIEAMADAADVPVPPPVDATADVLADVERFVRRYVVIGEEQLVAVALWVAHTHAFDAAHATPYLTVLSPEKRSGKTRLIEALALLVRGGWHAAGASEAALFRKISDHRPTLLLDEVDAIFGSHSERTEPLRAILNAGNRPGASVARCIGDGAKQSVVDFSVYCAKLLAGIDTGRLPDTIADLAIKIEMKRKTTGEPVERFYVRDAAPIAGPLRDRLAAWAQANAGTLVVARPELPDELSDRAGEAWEPLLAIADLAGGTWPARGREAALHLSASMEADDAASRGVQLLAAIRVAVGDRPNIATSELLNAVNADDDLAFGGWREGKGLDARGLGRLLKPYGVKSRTVRDGDATMKGYARFDFEDARARYLPPTPTKGSHPSHPSHDADPSHENPREHWDVTDVTDKSGEGGLSRHTAVNERHNGAASHEGALQNGDGRESCAQHPNAGRWRFAASDFWMCEGCYPRSEGASGVVVESASGGGPAQTSAGWAERPPEVPPDAPSPHLGPELNGHEPLATPEEEALLERATRLIGGDL